MDEIINEMEKKLNILLQKLELLEKKQNIFEREIHDIRNEIEQLRGIKPAETPITKATGKPALKAATQSREFKPSGIGPDSAIPKKRSRLFSKTEIEKFIGENLINKIGIIIIIIGVGIGAKYAIDNDLISPLVRIILAYVVGVVLTLIALRLKKRYLNFSAVLMSGGIAILYFTTYAANNFYGLFSQLTAFAIMLLVTIMAVISALRYDRQIIALLGLVGAYAVPFLLYPESDNPTVFFSYVALINIGILVVAFLRYWRLLYYASFVITWSLYFTWYTNASEVASYFWPAMVFITVSFLTFYAIFLLYKLHKNQKLEIQDIFFLLANSFIFYGLGYVLIEKCLDDKIALSIFTLANAVIHILVALLVFRIKSQGKALYYFTLGLAIAFVTILIPVHFDGYWVTLLWLVEALALFWVGRSQKEYPFEQLSAPLILLSFCSLSVDWHEGYGFFGSAISQDPMPALLNVYFGTSIIAIIIYSAYCIVDNKTPFVNVASSKGVGNKYIIPGLMSLFVPALLFLTSYLAFRLEVDQYWNEIIRDFGNRTPSNPGYISMTKGLEQARTIWAINYSLFFFLLFGAACLWVFKKRIPAIFSLIFNAIMVLVFLLLALYTLSSVRSWLWQGDQPFLSTGHYFLSRYVSILLFAALLYVSHLCIKRFQLGRKSHQLFEVILHLSIITVASSELIHWLNIMDVAGSDKLGLSILWGIYALLMTALGIWKKKAYLRICAIVLFAITLIKLFFYDIAHLDTIAKTVVFISLGALLLIISYLYIRYRNKIFDDRDEISPMKSEDLEN